MSDRTLTDPYLDAEYDDLDMDDIADMAAEIAADHDCVDYAKWDVYPKTWVCTYCNTIHDQFGDDE